MNMFPRTTVGGLSLSRLIIGSNWFLGWSHTSQAKDKFIRDEVTAEKAADIIEVFMNEGIDTVMGFAQNEKLMRAIHVAQDRVGRKVILISTPWLNPANTPEAESANAYELDCDVKAGAAFCLPHQSTTDCMVNRITQKIDGMDRMVAMIRERGMIPGLSTHMPETPVYADATGLDVETYIQIYNAAGFLMQIEVDWVHREIWKRKNPVMTIKPLAAGRLMPLVGLAFSWATLRDQDMITIGTMTPDEAKEVIEISRAQLDRRRPEIELQRTRSKRSLEVK